MKMLRRLPQILRFVPGTAQDVRAYFLALQYWLAGSEENIANLVRLLVDRYADGPRRVLRGTLNVSCDDVRALALPIMRHRIFTNFTADSEGITPDDLVKRLLLSVAEPGASDY